MGGGGSIKKSCKGKTKKKTAVYSNINLLICLWAKRVLKVKLRSTVNFYHGFPEKLRNLSLFRPPSNASSSAVRRELSQRLGSPPTRNLRLIMKVSALLKKVNDDPFPTPAGMTLTGLSLAGNNLIIPVQGEFD